MFAICVRVSMDARLAFRVPTLGKGIKFRFTREQEMLLAPKLSLYPPHHTSSTLILIKAALFYISDCEITNRVHFKS